MSQPGLLWFLARLEEGLRQGQALDADWICENHPDRIPDVQHALEQIEHLLPLLAPGQTDRPTLVPSLLLPSLPFSTTAPSTNAPLPDATLLGSSTPRVEPSLAPPSYQILGILGQGGMGVVYKARQARLERIVALKMILAGGHANLEEQQRFLAEAEAIAAITHPAIVQVFEFGTFESRPFLAMEYCPGGSLSHKLAGSPLPPSDAAILVAKLARGTQAAHDKGIIHRDLKPANVLLAEDGSPRITDFGLAKRIEADSHLTRTGALLGTPSYMAPEQARGESRLVGTPADIYALGAIFYECLTGRPPFRGATAMETIQQVLEVEPVTVRHLQPRVPRDLETICHKCLQKEAQRRYPSAAALADDLDRFLAGQPIQARSVGPLERGWKWVQRRPVTSGLILAFVLSLVGGTVVSSYLAHLAHKRAEQAQASEREARRALEMAGSIAVLLVSNAITPLDMPVVNREGIRSQGLSLAELVALEDLARLPRDIDRVQVLRGVLDRPEAARKLSWRLQPVLRALVGIDPDRRLATLGLAESVLRNESADPTVRILCARIFARLGGDDDTTARIACGLILDAAIGHFPPGERLATLEDLLQITTHLQPDTASWLTDRILEVEPKADPVTLTLLAESWQSAQQQVAPKQQTSGKLAIRLLARLEAEARKGIRPIAEWLVQRALLIVGDSLSVAEAQDAVSRFAELARTRKRAATLEAAAVVLQISKGRLPPTQTAEVASELTAEALWMLPGRTDDWFLGSLRHTLQQTVPLLGATSGPEIKALANAIRVRNFLGGAEASITLANTFVQLAGRIPEPERSDLARLLIDRMLPEVVPAPDMLGDRKASAVASVIGFLTPEQARVVLDGIATRIENVPPASRELLSILVGALAKRLPSAAGQKVAEKVLLATQKNLEKDALPLEIQHLARAVSAVADCLPGTDTRASASSLAQQISRATLATTDPAKTRHLAWAYAAIARLLPPEEEVAGARTLANRLLTIVTPSSKLDDLQELRLGLQELAPLVQVSEFDKQLGRFAVVVVREMAMEKWTGDTKRLLRSVTRPLSIEELADLLRQPACVGQARRVVMDVISEKVGEKFADVWQFVEWAEVNRPDIDLRAGLSGP